MTNETHSVCYKIMKKDTDESSSSTICLNKSNVNNQECFSDESSSDSEMSHNQSVLDAINSLQHDSEKNNEIDASTNTEKYFQKIPISSGKKNILVDQCCVNTNDGKENKNTIIKQSSREFEPNSSKWNLIKSVPRKRKCIIDEAMNADKQPNTSNPSHMHIKHTTSTKIGHCLPLKKRYYHVNTEIETNDTSNEIVPVQKIQKRKPIKLKKKTEILVENFILPPRNAKLNAEFMIRNPERIINVKRLKSERKAKGDRGCNYTKNNVNNQPKISRKCNSKKINNRKKKTVLKHPSESKEEYTKSLEPKRSLLDPITLLKSNNLHGVCKEFSIRLARLNERPVSTRSPTKDIKNDINPQHKEKNYVTKEHDMFQKKTLQIQLYRVDSVEFSNQSVQQVTENSKPPFSVENHLTRSYNPCNKTLLKEVDSDVMEKNREYINSLLKTNLTKKTSISSTIIIKDKSMEKTNSTRFDSHYRMKGKSWYFRQPKNIPSRPEISPPTTVDPVFVRKSGIFLMRNLSLVYELLSKKVNKHDISDTTDSSFDEDTENPKYKKLRTILKHMLKDLISVQDEKEKKPFSRFFKSLRSKDEFPDYYSSIRYPIDFNIIEKNITNGIYKNATTFDTDVERLFSNNLKYYGRFSEQGISVVRLKRAYAIIKSKYCAEIEKVMNKTLPESFNAVSDAADEDVIRCICGLFHDEGLMILCERCYVWQHCSCVKADPNCENYLCENCNPRKINFEIKLENQPPAQPKPNETHYLTLMRDDLQIRLYDNVYVLREIINPETGLSHTFRTFKDANSYEQCDIFRVEQLWKDSNGEKFVFGHHYLRPRETFHEKSRKFFRNEIVKVALYEVLPIDIIMGRCYVVDSTTFCKGKHIDADPENIYICEYRVNTSAKAFSKLPSKIKLSALWTKHYVFKLYDCPLKISRNWAPHEEQPPQNNNKKLRSSAACQNNSKNITSSLMLKVAKVKSTRRRKISIQKN